MTERDIAELRGRVAKLERAVAFFERHLGVHVPAEVAGVSPRVLALVRGGDKMAAIKAYREETGVDLKAAMEMIDSVE